MRSEFTGRNQTTIFVVTDNHKSHHTKKVKEQCARQNIRIEFTPPYSPEFNSIERLWGYLKRQFAEELLLAGGNIRNQAQLKLLLRKIERRLTKELSSRAALLNNSKYISRILEAGPEGTDL